MDLSGGEYKEFNSADDTDFSDIVHYGNYPVRHVQESSDGFFSAFRSLYESLDVLNALLCGSDLNPRPSLFIYGPEAEDDDSCSLQVFLLRFA